MRYGRNKALLMGPGFERKVVRLFRSAGTDAGRGRLEDADRALAELQLIMQELEELIAERKKEAKNAERTNVAPKSKQRAASAGDTPEDPEGAGVGEQDSGDPGDPDEGAVGDDGPDGDREDD